MKASLKAKLRALAAKAIRKFAPILADAVAKEVRRRVQPPATGPFTKTGSASK